MMQDEVDAADAGERVSPTLRLLSCIRIGEVCVLQGAPVIGACFSMAAISATTLFTMAVLVAGNMCLVAHVFVLNDLSGIRGDLTDPSRAAGTFLAKGENAARMGLLALTLLAISLALFGFVGLPAFVIACLIATLSAVYSLPGIRGKGIPLLNSLLHLFGGLLHFLLGYAAFAQISSHSVVIGCYFGLVFTAGHFTHEARDHDADLQSGIRTNAVAFGKQRSFVAGLVLFSASYALLTALAVRSVVPSILALAAVLYAVHLYAALQAWRSGLTFESVRRLQTVYRNIHVAIGLAMLTTVPPWPR